MIEALLTQTVAGFLDGDSILAHPALGSSFALIRLIPAHYGHLAHLENQGALTYVTGPMLPHEIERLVKVHFRTLEARSRGIALLR